MHAARHLHGPVRPGDVRSERRGDVNAGERVFIVGIVGCLLVQVIHGTRLAKHRSAKGMRPPECRGVCKGRLAADVEALIVIDELANVRVGYAAQAREAGRGLGVELGTKKPMNAARIDQGRSSRVEWPIVTAAVRRTSSSRKTDCASLADATESNALGPSRRFSSERKDSTEPLRPQGDHSTV